MFGLSTDRDWLSLGSDIAQALTGVVAAWAGIYVLCQRHARRKRLQDHLVSERKAAEAPGGQGSGARSIMHLMGRCSMTQAQVLEAAFGNPNIKTWIVEDEDTGRADTLMFRIEDAAWRKLGRT